MTIRHEDVPVSPDNHIGGRTKRIRAPSCHLSPPYFHEDLTVRIELGDLLTDLSTSPSSIHRQWVSHPNVTFQINMYSMGESKHLAAETLE